MAARNILVGVDKTSKITDFGLALIRDKYQYLYCTSIRKVSFEINKSKDPNQPVLDFLTNSQY